MIPETLGERLRAARLRQGLDQAFVANALGIHPKSISKWENDRQSPRLPTLERLARLYQTNVGSLVSDGGTPEFRPLPHPLRPFRPAQAPRRNPPTAVQTWAVAVPDGRWQYLLMSDGSIWRSETEGTRAWRLEYPPVTFPEPNEA